MKLFSFTALICILVSIITGIAFFAWTLFLRNARFNTMDFALTVKIQDNVPLQADQYLLHLSSLASFSVTVTILVITLVVFRKWIGVIATLGFFGLAHVVEIIGKGMLDHPPPPFRFYRHPNDHAFVDFYVPDHSSYPSGHSLRVVFIGIVLSFLIWNTKKVPLLVRLVLISIILGVITLTLVSRVSLGEHWSSDVIGGALLGMCFGSISLLFLQSKQK